MPSSTFPWRRHVIFGVELTQFMISRIVSYQVTMLRSASRFVSHHLELRTLRLFNRGSPNSLCTAQRSASCTTSVFIQKLPFVLWQTSRSLCTKPGRDTPTTHGVDLLSVVTAMWAYRNRHLSMRSRRCETWELVGQCFDKVTFESTALVQIVAGLTRGNIAQREDAVHSLLWSQIEKDMAHAKCWRSRHALSAKKRKLTLHAVD